GKFLIDLLNDKKNGKILLQHAEELEEENDATAEEDLSQQDPFSLAMIQNSGTVTIAGDIQNLGRITEVNHQTCKMTGWKRSDLIGQNVAKIIPKPYSDAHDDFLRRYLETGFGKIIDRQRTVLTLNKSGYIYPAYLCVKQIADNNGSIDFVATLRLTKNSQLRESVSENFMIVHSQDLRILHFTEDCTLIFGIIPNDMQLQSTIMQDSRSSNSATYFFNKIVPEFEENGGKYLTHAGYNTRITTSNQTFDLFIMAEQVDVLGKSFYIVRIKAKKNSMLASIDNGREDFASNEMMQLQCPFRSSDQLGAGKSIDDMPMNFSPSGSQNELSRIHNMKSSSNLLHRKHFEIPVPEMLNEGIKATSTSLTTSKLSRSAFGNNGSPKSSSVSSSIQPNVGLNFMKRIIKSKQLQSETRIRWLKFTFGIVIIVLIAYSIFEHSRFVRQYSKILLILTQIRSQANWGILAEIELVQVLQELDFSINDAAGIQSLNNDNALGTVVGLNYYINLADSVTSVTIATQTYLKNIREGIVENVSISLLELAFASVQSFLICSDNTRRKYTEFLES
ncbi:hypothetical protein HK096_007281, partial [Nowakowskiella sp. JEL0078]